MATRNLSDLLRALVALVRKEITEWKHALGWGHFYVMVAIESLRSPAAVKQTVSETV